MLAEKRLFLVFAVFTALLLVAAPVGAAPEPLDLAEAVELIESAGGPEEHPDANAVVIFDRQLVEFDETGAFEQYSHTLTKLLTDEGVDTFADHSVVYHQRYGTNEILMARVIKPDGTEIVVGDELITDGTPPTLSAMNIYETDFREKTVVFPNLEPGDAIELLTYDDYEPLLEDAFAQQFYLQFSEPILEASVTVQGPPDMPLKHAVIGDVDVEFEERSVVEDADRGENGEWTYYRWTARDVPQIEREIGMAPMPQIATRVSVSTIHEWEELSNKLWTMYDEKCIADEPVKELVADVTEGLETKEEKLRAIHYWILENVRYLGIGMDFGAFLEPHTPSYTLEKEYGICRDKALLMVAMLEEVDIPAWVTVINVSKKTDPQVPNTSFEHGIVAVEGEDGEYRFIDPTQETSREIFATYPGDRWVMVLREGGEDLLKAPHYPPSRNSGRIVEKAEIAGDGSIAGTVVVTGNGMYEEILRQIARATSPEQMRMMWEQSVQALYAGASMTSFESTDPEDLHEPMTITIGYEVEDYVLNADPYALFRVPSATGSFDFMSEILVGRLTSLPEREHPVHLGITIGLNEEAEITIPEGLSIKSMPDPVTFEEGVISLEMDYDFTPPEENDGKGLVSYSKSFGIDSFQISPEQYQHMRRAARMADRSIRGEVILMREES
jgi:transglutaminase-like putative cysteine protease